MQALSRSSESDISEQRNWWWIAKQGKNSQCCGRFLNEHSSWYLKARSTFRIFCKEGIIRTIGYSEKREKFATMNVEKNAKGVPKWDRKRSLSSLINY